MTLRHTLSVLSIASLSLLALPTQAATLYSHAFGAPGIQTAWCSSCGGSFRVWDQFTLGAGSTIDAINARLYVDNIGSGLNYSIWTADRSVELHSETLLAGSLAMTALGGPAFDVMAELADFNLGAGTYSLSIWTADGNLGWYQNGLAGNSFQTEGGGGSGHQLSFEILGDIGNNNHVPEPAGLVLAALLAAAGAGLARRRA